MKGARGFTILELLVSSLVGAIAAIALASFYVAMVNSFAWANSETVLQRQGGLALEAIGKQMRRASSFAIACAPVGTVGDSLQVTVPASLSGAGTYCYYAGSGANGAPAGALCERYNAGACRDLLNEGQGTLVRKTKQARLAVLTQTSPADPNCPRRAVVGQPAGVALTAGQPCLIFTTPTSAPGVEVGFAIGDGMTVRTFAASFNLRN